MFEFFREAKKRFQDRVEPILFPDEVARIRESEENIKQSEENIKRSEENTKRSEENTKWNEEKIKEIEARIAAKNAETEREEQVARQQAKRCW